MDWYLLPQLIRSSYIWNVMRVLYELHIRAGWGGGTRMEHVINQIYNSEKKIYFLIFGIFDTNFLNEYFY